MRDRWAIVLDRMARVLLAAGLFLMLAVIFVVLKDTSTDRLLIILVVMIACCFLGSLSLTSLAGSLQQRRNRIFATTNESDYFIYLRSFRGKELQTVTHSGGPANPSPNAFIVDDVTAELSEALMGIGMLFIIGSKETGSMAWSPTTILLRSSENTWRALFHRLSRGARGIFIIPGETPGILEELKELMERSLIHKVIVIMPPVTGRDQRPKKWSSVAVALAPHGYQLPEFTDNGMVYLQCR